MELLRSIRRGNLLFQNILISFITINLTEFKDKEHTIYCLVQSEIEHNYIQCIVQCMKYIAVGGYCTLMLLFIHVAGGCYSDVFRVCVCGIFLYHSS